MTAQGTIRLMNFIGQIGRAYLEKISQVLDSSSPQTRIELRSRIEFQDSERKCGRKDRWVSKA